MLRDVIESEKPLIQQIQLVDEQFSVNMGYKMFEPPATPLPDPPIEMPSPTIFSVAQVAV